MRALPFFLMLAVVFLGAAHVNATPADGDNQLTAVKGPVDTLKVRPLAFEDGKALKVAITPLHIDYPKKRRDPPPYYRDSDFQLTQRDIELLQKTITETFTASWLEKRHWQLVTDPAAADIRLVVDFKDFWLAAPLNEGIVVNKTYTEESVRFTLNGRLERASDGQHLVEFSDRRTVRQLGTPPGRFERFTAVTFWRDMRRDMDLFASQLNRLVPAAGT